GRPAGRRRRADPLAALRLVGLALLPLLTLALLTLPLPRTGLLLLALLPPSAAVAVRLALGPPLLVQLVPGPAQLGLRDHVLGARVHLVRQVGHRLARLLVVAAGQGVGGPALGLAQLRRARRVVGGLA